MTRPRGVRGVRHAVLAAVAAALACLRPAAAQAQDEFAWDAYGPPAVNVFAVDELIATAGVRVPRDVLLAAYERYLRAWRVACDAWGPASADLADSRNDQPFFPSVARERTRAEASVRAARDRERLEAALFADIAEHVPEADRGAVDRARVRRSLRTLLSDVWMGDDDLLVRLVRCDLDSAIDDALRDEPEALSAARAAAAPFAERRLAAARGFADASCREDEASARAAEAAGGTLSRSEWMQLRMDARPAAEGSEEEPAERIAQRERAQRRLDELSAVFESMSRAVAEIHRPAVRDLCRAQWDACRAALLAVEPAPRWKLFCGIFRDRGPGADNAVVPNVLAEPLRREDAGPECEECVHRAVERWRREGLERMMKHLERVVDEAGRPEAPDPAQASAGRSAKSRAELAEAAERMVAECRGVCPEPKSDGDDEEVPVPSAVVCDRLERIPEFASVGRFLRKLLAEQSGDPAAGEETDEDPYEAWSSGLTDHFGMAATSAWLRESLQSLGVPVDRLDAVDGIAADHHDRWESARGHDADAMRAMLPEDLWVTPQSLPAVRQQDAEGRRAAAAADAALVESLGAAFGDVLSESDRRLLAMVRSLGDARLEDTSIPFGVGTFRSIRANPADAVLAAGLQPPQRAAATEAIQARFPSLVAALASARGAARASDACASTAWSDGATMQSWAERRARSVAVEDARRAALQAERACRVAFDAAIDAACAAVPAEDAARVRATADLRRYPDAFRPEAALRTLWSALDAKIAPEDQQLREATARHVDRVLGLMADARAALIERWEALNRRTPIDSSWKDRIDAETRHSIPSFAAMQSALRILSVEQLRWAVPRDVRMRCRDWERYCRSIDARESDADLDSAP